MTDQSRAARPAPMEGKGAYNRSSRVQAAGLLPAVALLEKAASTVVLAAAPQPIVIADYGASEGHNSLLPIGVAIAALRTRVGPERAICVVHTDLPDNDFPALFQVLASDPDSYLRGDPAAFPSAVGRSYFQQILPSASVTLGWSSWAIQWLSRIPATIPDQVQVAYSRDPGAREAYFRQAAEDWRTFLDARSREMHRGACLVVLTMATDDAGDFGYRPLLEAMYAMLTEMTRDGFVRSDEFRRMAIPTVARSKADLVAPFADHGRFAGLSIEQLEIFHAEDRIWSRFETERDADAFGAQWAAFSRASVFPTLAAALEGGEADPRSGQFVERLEAGVAARLSAAPERMVMPLAQMVLVKSEGR
jgi:SAM dependent carboxyl methyltransferase